MTIAVEARNRLRQALRALPRSGSHRASTDPSPVDIFAPGQHGAALKLERALVVGNRGAGKSFWASVLQSESARLRAAELYQERELTTTAVALGFHEDAGRTEGPAPSSSLLAKAREQGFDSRAIWSAVLLRALEPRLGATLPGDFISLVRWAATDVESAEAALRRADAALAGESKHFLLVFDALDRLASDWEGVRALSTGILRFALDVRGYRAIRVKVFLRKDQLSDDALFRFPDASKLKSERVELLWSPQDLYGLLYQYLWNAPPADADFRSLWARELRSNPNQLSLFEAARTPRIDNVPLALLHSEDTQRRLFDAIAGEYMGGNPRRGRTYSWLHGHLADAHGQTSPRSFLIALRTAAEKVSPEVAAVLDYIAIKTGVQAASQVRVAELLEDYAWIAPALDPLQDLEVPVDRADLVRRWEQAHTVAAIEKLVPEGAPATPVEFSGASGASEESLLSALATIGVLEARSQGKVNVPDIFRVAAKIKRRGGVPVREQRPQR